MTKLEKYKNTKPTSGFKFALISIKSGFARMKALWIFGEKSKYPDGAANAKHIEGQYLAKSITLLVKSVKLFDSAMIKLLSWCYCDESAESDRIFFRNWVEYSFLGSIMSGGVFAVVYIFHSKLSVNVWLYVVCPLIILLQVSRDFIGLPN